MYQRKSLLVTQSVQTFADHSASRHDNNETMTTPLAQDPLFKPLHPSSTPSTSKTTTLSILNQAFPNPSTAQQIYTQKIEYRPVSINPADHPPNARSTRRTLRTSKLHPKRKPKPLSAKEKRQLRIYDIPSSETKYSNFLILNELWEKYISEIILGENPSTGFAGPILLKADYHGAKVRVEDCRCKERIGIQGIVVKETKNLFEIVTERDRLVKIPKEKSLFRVICKGGEGENGKELEWRIWGDQFLLRSGERASKKFSGRTIRGKALLEL